MAFVLLASSLLVCVLVYSLLPPSLKRQKLRFPPGPTPWPVIGNLISFSKLHSSPEAPCLDLKQRWGKLCMLWIGQQPVLVINDPQSAQELLNEKSAVYSSRPVMNHYRQKVWPWRLASTPAGDEFRSMRKIFHSCLSPQQSMGFRQYQDYESTVFARTLLEEPESFLAGVEKYTMSVTFSVVCGARLDRLSHPLLEELNKLWDVTMRYFEPGTLTMDFIPCLQYLPLSLQPWPKRLKSLVGREMELYSAFLKTLQRASAQGTAPDSFGKLLVQIQVQENISDVKATHMLAMLVGAGSDTCASVLQNVFKVIALNPEAVATAQKELDAVVGPDRLPTWQDEKALPYVRSFIKEVHRWAPIGDLGVPHCALKDDSYRGYDFPKGTIVFPNLPALMKDPERYKNPDVFDPRRFESDQLGAAASALQKDYRNRDHFHYGFGRRLCQGIHVAEASLYIVISRLLWGFTITAKDGYPLDVMDKYRILIWKPRPYEVNIQCRGPRYAAAIEQASRCSQTTAMSFDDVMQNAV